MYSSVEVLHVLPLGGIAPVAKQVNRRSVERQKAQEERRNGGAEVIFLS
jgi:hypothetical protein